MYIHVKKNKKNQHQHLNKAVSADPGWAQHATRTENPSTPRVGGVAGAALQCAQGDPRFRRRRGSGLLLQLLKMYAVPLFQPGGKKEDRPVLHGLSVCPRASSASHRYLTATRLHHLSVGSRIRSTVSVGPCAVCPARCRSSSEVNVPVHDLQAVAVLRLRATVLAIFTRNTLAHPPLPRVHRAPIGPSAHRAHSETRPNRSATTVPNS